MAAYDDYCLASFSKVDEAISYRIADANTYLAELDRRIERCGRNYRRIMNEREGAGTDLVLYRFDDLEDSEEYRRLFRQFLSDKKTYFEKLKELVPQEEWKEFATRLFRDIPHIGDEDCILVCDLIVREQLYRCLPSILMANEVSFHRSEIFAKYVNYLSEEEQTGFVNMIIDKLRDRLSFAKSKSYGYITDEMRVLHDSCPVGGKLISEFAKEVITRYGNRPALIRLLGV